eukprot:9501029-Pyramimonas_sp.AAC.2
MRGERAGESVAAAGRMENCWWSSEVVPSRVHAGQSRGGREGARRGVARLVHVERDRHRLAGERWWGQQ